MNPSKDANSYWQTVNRTMLEHGKPITPLWNREKIALIEGIKISKDIALKHYVSQRTGGYHATHTSRSIEQIGSNVQNRQSYKNYQRRFL